MKQFFSALYAVVPFTAILFFTGCSTMPNGRGWGQDATLMPGWDRLGKAALNAAQSPATWGPAVGALAFQIGDADHKVSDWASERTPIYGSQAEAQRMSDVFLQASGELWVLSAVAAPGGDVADWTPNKTKGFAVQMGAGILMRGAVGYLKSETDRTRPNGQDEVSFPSGHAAGAAFFTTLASRNIETYGWDENTLIFSRIGLGAVAVGTAWGRVEGDMHYPSDVLAAYAIGHFFGAFFTDAFLGLDNPRDAVVLFEPSKQGVVAKIQFKF